MSISSSTRKIEPPASDPSRSGRSAFCFCRRRGCLPGGFTLLEVMIAMAILAIALVAVYRSQSQSVSMVSDSRFLTTASLLAQSRMSVVDLTDAGALASAKGDFGTEFPDYDWQLEVADAEGLTNVKRIVLTVKNQRMTKRNSYRIVLYRAAKA